MFRSNWQYGSTDPDPEWASVADACAASSWTFKSYAETCCEDTLSACHDPAALTASDLCYDTTKYTPDAIQSEFHSQCLSLLSAVKYF